MSADSTGGELHKFIEVVGWLSRAARPVFFKVVEHRFASVVVTGGVVIFLGQKRFAGAPFIGAHAPALLVEDRFFLFSSFSSLFSLDGCLLFLIKIVSRFQLRNSFLFQSV